MIKREFTFKGDNSMAYELHGVIWYPDQRPTKVLQIAHGMTEHIGRYEILAERLTNQGIAVAGFDLRGHGKNVGDKNCASFGRGGWKAALGDMHIFYEMLRAEFPDTKHYMFGFSLGSFLLREYLTDYHKDEIAGAVIVGTGYQPAFLLNILLGILKGEIKKAGWNQATTLVRELSFGTYNKKFKPNRTSSDWLCSDEETLDEFLADKLRRKDISAGLFSDLLTSMKKTGQENTYEHWCKDMPVLLISGKEDSVGNMGKGVCQVQKQMISKGLKNVQMELLDHARHDVLHECKSGASKKTLDMIEQWIK